MTEKIITIEQPTDPSYKEKEGLGFELISDNNSYTNLESFHICFHIHFKKFPNTAANLDTDIYLVNKFFPHWVKEINILKKGTNKFLIPTLTLQEIYQYSDLMLKHWPKNVLKMIENDLLYREELVIIKGFDDRRIHNTNNKVSRTDDSLENRQDEFDAQIDAKYVYRVPLKYFCDLGKINFPTKID